MKRTPLRRRATLHARKPLQRSSSLQRTPSMVATDAQPAAVAGRSCIVCGTDRRMDPAHLIPRSMGGCGDPLCVIPACRVHHRAYDRGELDLLPYLEPGAGAARACRRARAADRSAAQDQRRPPGPQGGRITIIAVALTAKKPDVKIGDLIEIEGAEI
jgi:hypothetical protein